MISDKQLQANVQNAQLGGVKTADGKAITRFNAVKHGILKQSLTEYEKDLSPSLLNDLTEQLIPVGILEAILVERIAFCYIRLFRVAKSEREFIESKLNPRITRDTHMDEIIKSLGRGEQVVQEGYTPRIDVSSIGDLESTILRYETTIERSLYKALHELQRLQASRLGQSLIPVNIDLSKNE